MRAWCSSPSAPSTSPRAVPAETSSHCTLPARASAFPPPARPTPRMISMASRSATACQFVPIAPRRDRRVMLIGASSLLLLVQGQQLVQVRVVEIGKPVLPGVYCPARQRLLLRFQENLPNLY